MHTMSDTITTAKPRRARRGVETFDTIESIEARGELVHPKHSGYSPGMFTYWVQTGSLQEGKDYEDISVLVAHRNGNFPRSLRFYRRESVARLAAVTQSDRSKEVWKKKEYIEEDNGQGGKRRLARQKQACKILWVSANTLKRWSGPNGIPFLDDRILTTFLRPLGDDGIKYWDVAELEDVIQRINRISTKPEAAGYYTLERAKQLTGLCEGILCVKEKRRRYGFTVLEPAPRVKAVRTNRLSGPNSCYRRPEKRVLFDKEPIDDYVDRKSKLLALGGRLLLRDAAAEIGINHGTLKRLCNLKMVPFHKEPAFPHNREEQGRRTMSPDVVDQLRVLRQETETVVKFAEALRNYPVRETGDDAARGNCPQRAVQTPAIEDGSSGRVEVAPQQSAPRRGKAGRHKDEDTWKLYQFCHDNFKVKGLLSSAVRLLANKEFFQGIITDDGTVRVYAARYAKFLEEQKQQ
jgi:hypothetical protein